MGQETGLAMVPLTYEPPKEEEAHDEVDTGAPQNQNQNGSTLGVPFVTGIMNK